MSDEELAKYIAETALFAESKILGIELLESKFRIQDERGTAIVHFNPDVYRNYGYKGAMRVMISRPDKKGIVRDKHYAVRCK